MRYTIRAKISVALLGLVILATGTMGAVGYFMLIDTMRARQGDTLMMVAQLQAERIEERLNNKEKRLLAATQELETYRADSVPKPLQNYLNHFVSEFLWLAVVAPKGETKAVSGSTLQNNQITHFSHSPVIQKAIKQPRTIVISSLILQSDGQPSLHMAIADQTMPNATSTVLVGALSLDNILPNPRTNSIGQNGFILVIDTQGRMLSYPNPDQRFKTVPTSGSKDQDLIAQASAMQSGFGETNLFNHPFLIAFAPVQKQKWSVLAVLPHDEFMAPIHGFALWFLGLFALVITSAGLLSWVISGGVTTPLTLLTSAIISVANGRLSTRVQVTSQDEAGQLATSFNKMAEDLESTDRKLRQEIKTRIRAEQSQRLATEEAKRANQAKSDFLATMSHEIRTPMNTILGMTELLNNNEPDANQRHEYIQALQRNGEALLILINDILDISKMEAGLIHLNPAPFDLNALQTRVISMFQLMAAENGLQLAGYIEPTLPTIRFGDAQRLQQILINLVGNAIKFTVQGVVTLRVRAAAASSGEQLLFEIADTGIGIDQTQTDSIFEKFMQADGSSTRQFGGTGLGLALCKNLVKLMEGDIWVESQPNQGSHFYFTIPLPVVTNGQHTTPISTSAKRHSEISLQNLQLLLVEDSQDNVLLIRAFLKKTGIHITHAQQGQEGLDLFKTQHFDLILMDMQMPIMDGYSATLAIRNWEATQKATPTPIVALTAYALTGDVEKSLSVGCDAHLSKPINRDKLLDAIKRHAKMHHPDTPPTESYDPNLFEPTPPAAQHSWLENDEIDDNSDPFHF